MLNPFLADLDKFIPNIADSPLLSLGFEVITSMAGALPQSAISFGRFWFLKGIHPEYPEWKRRGFSVWLLDDRLFVSDIYLSCTILVRAKLTIQVVKHAIQSNREGDLQQFLDTITGRKGLLSGTSTDEGN